MPANFTKEEKEILMKKFYEQGYNLLQKFGYKKLKVSDITKEIGIGTGTFYNFFKSKDDYIIWLIGQRKMVAVRQFQELAEEYPKGIPFEVMKKYLIDTVSNYNIYRCLNQEDYNKLQEKFKLLENRNEKVIDSGKFMLSKLKTKKTIDDFILFSEAYTVIIIGTSDLTKLNAKLVDEVIEKLVDSACRILY